MSEFKIDGLGIDTVVPDGIEPVEALRCWGFENDTLCSLNGVEWRPMKPLVAVCEATHAESYSWKVIRGGMTREEATREATELNNHGYFATSFTYGNGGMTYPFCPHPFTADLPPGYGYELETHIHEAPDECCTCGIYAATDAKVLPPSGVVYGKVKLWGKIIPGERGVRAQYAYPSEFEVGADLADHPALKAFGVPITVVDRPLRHTEALVASGGLVAPLLPTITFPQMQAIRGGVSFSTTAGSEQREGRWLRVAVAANLIACVANLAMFFVNAAVLH